MRKRRCSRWGNSAAAAHLDWWRCCTCLQRQVAHRGRHVHALALLCRRCQVSLQPGDRVRRDAVVRCQPSGVEQRLQRAADAAPVRAPGVRPTRGLRPRLLRRGKAHSTLASTSDCGRKRPQKARKARSLCKREAAAEDGVVDLGLGRVEHGAAGERLEVLDAN